jgi:putative ABC transport system permease protein
VTARRVVAVPMSLICTGERDANMKTNMIGLWLRWSWRDLKARWLQVAAIALIIALGTGMYAGLTSTSPWRLDALDDSYELLNMYDLRMTLPANSFIDQDELLAAVSDIPAAGDIEAAEGRLISSTQVDVISDERFILVPGRIFGVNVQDGGPAINDLHITDGRALTADDAGNTVAVLEYNFARHYELAAGVEIAVSGGHTLEAVAVGMAPEYFMVMTDTGGMMAESNFAAVFVPLETAQVMAGREGMVNDLLLTVRPGADLAVIEAQIEDAVAEISGVGVSFMLPDDDPVFNLLYEDIDEDQEVYDVVSALVLLGAAFGAFNLTSRMIDSQRRQIGVCMALGTPASMIAIRPLLVSLQIALLGVVFGFGLGHVISGAIAGMIEDFMAMPVFETPFQVGIFARAALLGIALPFVATLFPVIRALRMQPVDAVRTGHGIGDSGGLAPLLARVPLPGKSFSQIPFRNLLRSSRRTLFTALGIAFAIMVLVMALGVLDTFNLTLSDARAELIQNTPGLMAVELDFVYPASAPVVQSIKDSPVISEAEANLRLGGYLIAGDQRIESFIDMLPTGSGLWRPTLSEGEWPGEEPALILSRKAADDLGVGVGDTILLEHPQRTGLFSYDMVEAEIPIAGIHRGMMRFQSYMDHEHASLMGVAGLVNQVSITPAEGVTQDEVRRALFDIRGVATVQPVVAMLDMFEDVLGVLVGMLSIVAVFVLIMALLIAYNSTSINLDERAREIATMFAFGLPVRTVVRMAIVENAVIGIIATLIGIALGYVALIWMVTDLAAIPEILFARTISPGTILIAVVIGVLVVALTPVFGIRRMMGMDIPSTLRVME